MDALDNKCPACGAKITFNPVNQKWDCGYCGSKFDLKDMQKYNNASSEAVNEQSNVSTSSVVVAEGGGNIDVYRCKNCGAEIMADETTTSTFCLYCGSTAILKDKINSGRVPNYIIPFKNVKDDAVEAFKKLTKKRPLTPKCFKDPKNIEKITGVYIPFWAYDLEASGTVQFEGEDSKTWSDDEYYYTKIDKYDVRKSGRMEFDKVLSDASSRFSDDLMDSLEPFDFKQLTEYNHAYLSGFLAEKYDVDENVGLERASGRTNDTAVSLMKNTVRHHVVRVINNQVSVARKNTYYILLPVWMVSIKYKDKNHIFAMNGQTGKLIGDIPIGVKETITWALLMFIVIFIAAFFGLKYL